MTIAHSFALNSFCVCTSNPSPCKKAEKQSTSQVFYLIILHRVL